MKQSFAQKLIFTAAVLNCATRKDLCARFRAINPATEFELERSYKWLQGRALPRSKAIYDDWARLLGTARDGTWIAACSVEAFVDELCTLYSVDRAEVVKRAEDFSGTRGLLDARPDEDADPVCGTYLGYSWAWSPYQRGRMIRSWLQVAQKSRRLLEGTFWEELPDGPVLLRGSVEAEGGLLQSYLRSTGNRTREHLTLSVLLPGRPISLMCGRLQGAIIAGPFIRPSSTRIVLLRCDQPPATPAPTCYLDADAATIGAELARYLPPGSDHGPLAGRICRFLTSPADGPVDQVTGEDLAQLLIP